MFHGLVSQSIAIQSAHFNGMKKELFSNSVTLNSSCFNIVLAVKKLLLVADLHRGQHVNGSLLQANRQPHFLHYINAQSSKILNLYHALGEVPYKSQSSFDILFN